MCPRERDPTIHKHTCVLFEYGEAREGYWTSERFMVQLKKADNIAEVKKYPRRKDGQLFGFLIIVVAMLPCPRCDENECESRQ